MDYLYNSLLNRKPSVNEVLFFVNNNYNFKQINQFILRKKEYRRIVEKNRNLDNKVLEDYNFISTDKCKNNLVSLFKKYNRDTENFSNNINKLKNEIRKIYKKLNSKIKSINQLCDEELNQLLIVYFNNLSLIEVELNIINSDEFLTNSKLYINNIFNE